MRFRLQPSEGGLICFASHFMWFPRDGGWQTTGMLALDIGLSCGISIFFSSSFLITTRGTRVPLYLCSILSTPESRGWKPQSWEFQVQLWANCSSSHITSSFSAFAITTEDAGTCCKGFYSITEVAQGKPAGAEVWDLGIICVNLTGKITGQIKVKVKLRLEHLLSRIWGHFHKHR